MDDNVYTQNEQKSSRIHGCSLMKHYCNYSFHIVHMVHMPRSTGPHDTADIFNVMGSKVLKVSERTFSENALLQQKHAEQWFSIDDRLGVCLTVLLPEACLEQFVVQ